MSRFNSEREFQEALVEHFERMGWGVQTEVWSNCRSGRADMIAEHSAIGRIAFELKVLDGATGRPAAEAVKQLSKYRSLEFNSETIDLWVLAVHTSDSVSEREKRLLQSMFNDLGFGFIRWHTSYKISFAVGKNLSIRAPGSLKEFELDQIKKRVEKHRSDW